MVTACRSRVWQVVFGLPVDGSPCLPLGLCLPHLPRKSLPHTMTTAGQRRAACEGGQASQWQIFKTYGLLAKND